METLVDTLKGKGFGTRDIALTWSGFNSVNWDRCDDEFEFVFGDDKKVCRVHSILAEFLSPKVARDRKCDGCCGFYKIKSSSSDLFDLFEDLVSSLRSGRAFRVEASNFSSLLRLSQELENKELLCLLMGMIDIESMTLEEGLLVLESGIDLGIVSTDEFQKLRESIASHFYEVKKEILENIKIETAELLLSSPSLKIEDEDSLYDFVRSRSENDLSFSSLFEFIYFEYLSKDRVEDFASFAKENLLENISAGIWNRICCRLILEIQIDKNNPRGVKPPGKEFVYDESNPLNGVIAHLTRECGGNVHDKGIVNVTSSTFGSSACEPKLAVNVLNPETSTWFASKNLPDSWICYDFKDSRVSPTSYSVRSFPYGPRNNHLKSWVFEVSKDGDEWTIIDRRDNNEDLNGKHVTRNFRISPTPSESFRFIRLRQTGKTHKGEDWLTLTALEIFGFFSEK